MTTPAFTKTTEGTATFYVGTVRKQTVTVTVCEHVTGVYVANASAKAWRGGGRTARRLELLLPFYKSEEMRAFLQSIIQDMRPAENVVKFPA